MEKLKQLKYQEGQTWKDLGVHPDVGRAYTVCKCLGNELLDFQECINDDSIKDIVDNLRKWEIKQFTISSGYSNAIKSIGIFVANGCEVIGSKEVETIGSVNLFTNEKEKEFAILLKICD